MSKRILALLATAALTVSMLAGCGASDDAASSAPAASAPAAASSAPAASEPASDLDYIKGKGEMIIGYTVYAPMNYTDENGEFVGFDTELAEAVCDELGVTPVFQEIVIILSSMDSSPFCFATVVCEDNSKSFNRFLIE